MDERKRCTLVVTDFHGRCTERSVDNRAACGEGRGSADWLGIGTERGKMYGVDSIQASSLEDKV